MLKRGKPRDKDRDKDKKKRKMARPRLVKKKCRFCTDKNITVSYMDQQQLRRLITERGKITPSRITGTCAKHQRKVANSVKRARNMGILPFVAE